MGANLFPVSAEFSERGKYERLALGIVAVEIGLEKPFSVLHISDTHLTAVYEDESEAKKQLSTQRTRTFGGHQEEALADALAWAKQNCECVIHTGDLLDFQSRANFDLARKYYGPDAGIAMFGTMGNHEHSPDLWLGPPPEKRTEEERRRLRADLEAAHPFDVELNAHVVNGVNFVLLDNSRGTVGEAQVARFEREVAKGLPIVLAMHVPIFSDGLWRKTVRFWQCMNSKFTQDTFTGMTGDYRQQFADPVTAAFIARLRREPLLKCVLTGHNHFAAAERFSPTAMQYVVAPNFLFQANEVLFF